MDYDSLQAFLEANLKDGLDHSQEAINALKVKWRKLYLSEYNRKYKEDNIQITFRLNRKQHRKLITKAKQKDQKPTVYCRRLVIEGIEGNTAIDHNSLRIMIMDVIDIIEQAQYEGKDIPGEKVLKIPQQNVGRTEMIVKSVSHSSNKKSAIKKLINYVY